MNKIKALLFLILLTSCQVTETITMNPDGSGNIELYHIRDENSIDQLGRPANAKQEKFRDTMFVFQDYIKMYHETFVKLSKSDQDILLKHANVKMRIKVDPIQREHFYVTSFDFNKVEEIPDIVESFSLSNSLKENHKLINQFFKIKYVFDGSTFKRNVIIVDERKYDKLKEEYQNRTRAFNNPKLAQSYTLQYSFPRKIKWISNSNAIISPDKKTLKIEFKLVNCFKNPEDMNLEVVLE